MGEGSVVWVWWLEAADDLETIVVFLADRDPLERGEGDVDADHGVDECGDDGGVGDQEEVRVRVVLGIAEAGERFREEVARPQLELPPLDHVVPVAHVQAADLRVPVDRILQIRREQVVDREARDLAAHACHDSREGEHRLGAARACEVGDRSRRSSEGDAELSGSLEGRLRVRILRVVWNERNDQRHGCRLISPNILSILFERSGRLIDREDR